MPHVYVEGIGLSNVRERLRVLYGADFRLEIESRRARAPSFELMFRNLNQSCRKLCGDKRKDPSAANPQYQQGRQFRKDAAGPLGEGGQPVRAP